MLGGVQSFNTSLRRMNFNALSVADKLCKECGHTEKQVVF